MDKFGLGTLALSLGLFLAARFLWRLLGKIDDHGLRRPARVIIAGATVVGLTYLAPIGAAARWVGQLSGVDAVVFTSAAMRLGFACIAIAAQWWLVRALNLSRGVTWSGDIWPQLKAGNQAVAIVQAATWLGIAILLAAALGGCTVAHADTFPTRYDRQIRRASELYLPGIPWRLLKAQYWQESRFDPMAVSPAGAKGFAQLMPGTARDVFRAINAGAASPFMVEPSILGGAYYMGRMRAIWKTRRPWPDRMKLSQASYNAGAKRVLDSQRACPGSVLYAEVIRCLPRITGRNSKETLTYVERIWRYFAAMSA